MREPLGLQGRRGAAGLTTRLRERQLLVLPALAAILSLLFFLQTVLAPQASGYSMMTPPCAWGPPDLPVPWSLNTSLDEPSIAGKHEFDIVRDSFNRWINVPGVTISVQEGPTTAACGLTENGVSHISFRDCLNQCTGGCLAVTSTILFPYGDGFWNPGTDTLFLARQESDMTFSRNYNFDDYHDWPPCSGAFDLYGITVHELGHFFGLGHSLVGASTMYASIAPCDSTKASLHADDKQGFRVLYATTATPIAVTTLDAGQARLSVTNKGNLAYSGPGGKWGDSFQYPIPGRLHVFECSFALAQVGGPVSDNFRLEGANGGDADLQQASTLETAVPGPITDQQAYATFRDIRAESPYGVTVHSRFYADQDAPNDAFVIAEYLIVNESGSILSNLRSGLFADVDFNNDYVNNSVGYEADIYLAWVSTPNTTSRIGFAVLNPEGAAAMRALYATSSLPAEQFTHANKTAWMSGAFERTTLGPADIALVLATGNFTLAPGDTGVAAFALVGGTSLAELRTNAQQARTFYLNSIYGTTSDVVDGRPISPVGTLAPSRPNPFVQSTRLEYTLYEEGPVRLEVLDASGRLVRNLVRGSQGKGLHTIVWDGADDNGRRLASGVYFSRLLVSGKVLTKKLTLLK